MSRYLASQMTAAALAAALCFCTVSASAAEPAASEAAQTAAPLRHTAQGLVRGILEEQGRTQAYLGIAYAKAPVGALRWKEPVKPALHAHVLDATRVPARALQIQKGKPVGSDDCLYLNIWRPNSLEGNLPVMVFLHGGNNQTGASTAASYGKALAANANAIVVGLNYRLGPLGFVELAALKNGTDAEKSGNFTLLDINAALDWVRANIVHFGGNPKNITIAGHSAGGRDVMAILTSPMFKGKFQKAMAFSGSQTMSAPEWAEPIHTRAFAKLAVEDGRAADEASAMKWLRSGGADVREWLYGIDSKRIVRLMSGAKIRMRVFPHLFADGKVLPREGFKVYDSAKRARTVSDVPLLLLADKTEFKFYCATDPLFKDWVADKSVMTDPYKRAQYAFASGYGSQFFGYANTQQSAERISRHTRSPIYVASFRWGTDPKIVGEEMAFVHGSKHGIHMDFVFSEKKFDLQKKYPDAYRNEGVKDLSRLVQSYIGNFLRSGNPNGRGLVNWKPWSNAKGGATYLYLDADGSKASARMTTDRMDPKKVFQAMDADRSVKPEDKARLIARVMDGRFFSAPLDKHYGNPAHIMP